MVGVAYIAIYYNNNSMNYQWSFLVHLGIISLGLVLATFIRAKVSFFQKYLIPNSLIAGFILLPLYNFVFPYLNITQHTLGEFAYHLLSLSFVALSFKTRPKKEGTGRGNIRATSLSVILQFGVQGFIGLMLTVLFIKTIKPDLIPSFGYLMALGFAQGPGQAYSIGQSWNASFGTVGAGNIGLTFSALGFIFCSFGGVFIINKGIKNGWVKKEEISFLQNRGMQTGVYPKGTKLKPGSYLTTETEAIDSLSLNVAVVFLGYLLVYLVLFGLDALLSLAGPLGEQLADTFWGLSFVFAAVIGLLLRKFVQITDTSHAIDNMTMNRLTGLFVDLMVTAAIAAISLVLVAEYWFIILITAVLGILATTYSTIWFTSRVFTDHRFFRMLLIFGCSSGTLSTGLALLRVVDPDFETPVSTDYTYSSALSLIFAMPYILTVHIPLYSIGAENLSWLWAAIGINVLYLLGCGLLFFKFAGNRAFKYRSKLWYPEEP